MDKGVTLVLYSTQGCHLCEMALTLIASFGLTVEVIDIAFDERLFERYGVTIPVLSNGGSELNWPFDTEELKHWLDTNGITYHT